MWIQRFGLIGQAFGTLVPVAAGSIFILWPAARRRVGVGWSHAFRLAVLPAVWPLGVTVVPVLALKMGLPTIPSVIVTGTAGALCYAGAFFGLAIDGAERARYRAKLRQAVWWRHGVAGTAV